MRVELDDISSCRFMYLSFVQEVVKPGNMLQGMSEGVQKEYHPLLVAGFEGAAAFLPLLSALCAEAAGGSGSDTRNDGTWMLRVVERIAIAAQNDGEAEDDMNELMQMLLAHSSVLRRPDTELATSLGAAIMLETKVLSASQLLHFLKII